MKQILTILLLVFVTGINIFAQEPVQVNVSGVPDIYHIGQANSSRNIAVAPNGDIFVVYASQTGIYLARSNDAGISFLPATVITTQAPRFHTSSYSVDIHISRNSTIHIAWENYDQIFYSRSDDNGVTFSPITVAGPSPSAFIGNGVHIDSYGNNVYLLETTSHYMYKNTNDGIGPFQQIIPDARRVFSDIRVDPSNGDIYIFSDDAFVRAFKSTDDGNTFIPLPITPGYSQGYSTFAVSIFGSTKYMYNSGVGSFGHRVDLNTGTHIQTTYGTNTNNMGRTIDADPYGNVIDGFFYNGLLQFKVSNDYGMSFTAPIVVESGFSHDVLIDRTRNNILVVYMKDGDIFLKTYPDLLFVPPLFPPDAQQIALWYNPESLFALSANDPVSLWYDDTNPQENAYNTDPKRQPSYVINALNDQPGVQFRRDYGDHGYGNSDIMISDNEKGQHDEITTYSEDKWNPEPASKSLFINFQLGDYRYNPQQGEQTYNDDRMTIFEAGGPSSGYNAFINNGKFVFGMWNKIEKKYLIYDAGPQIVYPLVPGQMYFLNMEYDGAEKQFRALVGVESQTELNASPFVKFQGLTRDGNDKSAIGGASRTRFHDYSIGADYAEFFDGIYGDVILYDRYIGKETSPNAQSVYDYFNQKYMTAFAYYTGVPKQSSWKIIEFEENDQVSDISVSKAYPNPFVSSTTIVIDSKQNSNYSIELYDQNGSVVYSNASSLNLGFNEIIIDGSNLSNGVYSYTIKSNSEVFSGRVVLNK